MKIAAAPQGNRALSRPLKIDIAQRGRRPRRRAKDRWAWAKTAPALPSPAFTKAPQVFSAFLARFKI
jgi:hypothetical protein